MIPAAVAGIFIAVGCAGLVLALVGVALDIAAERREDYQ